MPLLPETVACTRRRSPSTPAHGRDLSSGNRILAHLWGEVALGQGALPVLRAVGRAAAYERKDGAVALFALESVHSKLTIRKGSAARHALPVKLFRAPTLMLLSLRSRTQSDETAWYACLLDK